MEVLHLPQQNTTNGSHFSKATLKCGEISKLSEFIESKGSLYVESLLSDVYKARKEMIEQVRESDKTIKFGPLVIM